MFIAPSTNAGMLMKTPFKDWHKASDYFKEHVIKNYHDATISAEQFYLSMNNIEKDIIGHIYEQAAENIEANRKVLKVSLE